MMNGPPTCYGVFVRGFFREWFFSIGEAAACVQRLRRLYGGEDPDIVFAEPLNHLRNTSGRVWVPITYWEN